MNEHAVPRHFHVVEVEERIVLIEPRSAAEATALRYAGCVVTSPTISPSK
jgi:hypothetical protein